MSDSDPLFYCPVIPDEYERITLDERESRHAGGSRRLGVGDTLSLFDGEGTLAIAGFVEKTSDGVCLEIQKRETHAPDQKVMHLVCPIPKGDRAGVLLDMATQVGMTDFTPLICERGLNERITGTARQRWQRVVVEACKQSRRLFFPRMHEPASLEKIFQDAKHSSQVVWVADATGKTVNEYKSSSGISFINNVMLIGPEGGFSASEILLAKEYQANFVCLGNNVLRIETAAVLVVAELSRQNISPLSVRFY